MKPDPNQIEILKIFNLLQYDHDMRLLYRDLKTWLGQNFNGSAPEFKPNQRIIFLHNDVDYYIDQNSFGFTLYNLQLILRELDISNYFCAVTSTTKNYHQQTELVQKIATVDDFPIAGITAVMDITDDRYLFKNFCDQPRTQLSQVDFPFTVISRRSRTHRSYFMAQLFDKNLHNKGLIGYHNIPDFFNVSISEVDTELDCPCAFLRTDPWQRVNSTFLLKDHNNQQIFRNFLSTVPRFKNFNEDIDITTYDAVKVSPILPIQQSLIYVALETVINYPSPFLSWISFKGVAEKRPWIIFARPGQLKFMQELGLKTFNDFWDEGYDSINDTEQRVDAIVKILSDISKLSQRELNQLLIQMQPILDYNFEFLRDRFDDQEHEKLYQGLIR